MFTRAFAKATLERAVKTFAQSLAALLVADGTDILTTDWRARLSVAAMAAVVSVLTSVGSAGVGDRGPSLAGEVLEPTAPVVNVTSRLEPYAGDPKSAAAHHGEDPPSA